jgi:hypothetical protein
MIKQYNFLIILLVIILNSNVFAHPTGNMIVVGEHVLWSYVNPVDDPNHHACIMIWSNGSEPKPFITSRFEASDYMLYNQDDEIYIIERRFVQSSQKFELRILKTKLGDKPETIWPWFEDNWRIGEGGFYMKSDDELVFGSYPNLLTIKKGGEPALQFDFKEPIKRVRLVSENTLLLLGDTKAWLTDDQGNIIEQWDGLIADSVQNAPLNRNQIFDIDYHNGELLLAYWGNRSFDLIGSGRERVSIIQQKDPLAPHWVTFRGDNKLLFSSTLTFDGSNPKPHLVLYTSNKDTVNVWTMDIED